MKTLLLKILLIIIAIAFFLGMFGIAELIAKVLTINIVMTIAYIMLGISFIYILKD